MEALREAFALLGVLGPIAYLSLYWSTLPAIVPVHFGMDGQPNRFAPKSFMWVFVAMSVGTYLLLLAITRFPKMFNLPRPVGDQDRSRLEALGIQLLAWLRLEIAYLFAFIVWLILQGATHPGGGLDEGFTFILPVVILGTVGFYLWRMKQPGLPI